MGDAPEIFAALTVEDWGRLAPLGETLAFDRPSQIVRKGAINRDLYYVLEGQVQASIDEAREVISAVSAGEFFGEISLLDGRPTSAAVIAQPGARVLRIDGAGLQKLCGADPVFAARFYRYLALLLARRLRRSTELMSGAAAAAEDEAAPVRQSLDRTIAIRDFTFRSLRSAAEITQAMALLHEVYIGEYGWKVYEANPSRARVERTPAGVSVLTDKYSGVAHWFGALHGERLVACVRALPNPRQELREYLDLPLFLSHAGVTEINRLAVLQHYRAHESVTLLLLRLAFDHAFTLGSTAFLTLSTVQPGVPLGRMGLVACPDLPPARTTLFEPGSSYLHYLDARFHERSEVGLYGLTERALSATAPAGAPAAPAPAGSAGGPPTLLPGSWPQR